MNIVYKHFESFILLRHFYEMKTISNIYNFFTTFNEWPELKKFSVLLKIDFFVNCLSFEKPNEEIGESFKTFVLIISKIKFLGVQKKTFLNLNLINPNDTYLLTINDESHS